MRYAMRLAIVLAVLVLVNARPSPQFDDGREGLVGRETVYYGYPFFWYRRPVYDDSGDERDIVYRGQVSKAKRKSPSTVSYVNVGAGWGR